MNENYVISETKKYMSMGGQPHENTLLLRLVL